VVIDDLRTLKEKKYPDLSWTVDPKLGTTALLEQVKDKKLATPLLTPWPSAFSSAYIRKSPWRLM
jgi:membrane-bound lytic murein transglycosylase MltF